MASTETSPCGRPGGGPVARSPIVQHPPVRSHREWEVSAARSKGALRLADLTPLTKVLVRSAPASRAGRKLECPFGRTRRDSDGSLVIGAGPDEWLVLSPAGAMPPVTAHLDDAGGAPAEVGGASGDAGGAASDARGASRDAGGGSDAGGAATDDGLLTVIDMTHGSVVLRLTGPNAHRVLEKICAIDFSDRVTPDGTSFRSSVARLRCTVVRDDLAGERSYLIESDRSSGQYLFDALLDAGAEFAIEVDGYPDKEI